MRRSMSILNDHRECSFRRLQSLSGQFLCGVFQMEQLSGRSWRMLFLMRMNDMSPEMFLGVACPTCGVAIGDRCLLSAGGLRSESHVDRKLCAAEAAEQNRIRPIRTRET